MLKIPRFIREYANEKRKTINALPIEDKRKTAFLENVSGAEYAYSRGLITTDEAIKLILDSTSYERET